MNNFNINDLTVGQAKELAALFSNVATIETIQGEFIKSAPHPFVGKYVIARCYAAGVHAGEVVSVEGENVILKNSRRLWSWKAKDGVALSGVAQAGLKDGSSKLDILNPEIYLSGVCELIPCAAGVKESINAYK
jgi:hypothetical protein